MKLALLSVTDKTGLPGFARGLAELGFELVSTGGTARQLSESGLAVTEVSTLTGFPEMLDGRVKTLHPVIHGGLLGVRSNPGHVAAMEQHAIRPISLVAVNLYPFEQSAARSEAGLEELIENIDIGGPAMIRSAAKNYQHVAVLVSPSDYPAVLEELRQGGGELSLETRWRLAQKAFASTAAYDQAIASTLARVEDGKLRPAGFFPPQLSLHLKKLSDLRYGENPHQQAALYRPLDRPVAGLAAARQLQGRELSYNNLVDLDAAWELVQEFEPPATVIIKHTNPCGAATAATQSESFTRALATDPVSAYGGVVAFNRALASDTAEEVSKLFVEAIVAPGFAPGARERLAGKKNLRLMEITIPSNDALVWKQIGGGILLQTADRHRLGEADLRVVTRRAPTAEELRGLLFAWKVAKHVKSNAIVYAGTGDREGQLLGVGAGQMSRVDSVKIGASRAVLPLDESVLASDAFFPFPDSIEEAAKAGITAAIQPGGSLRDNETIDAADRLNLAMIFTGVRHFRH